MFNAIEEAVRKKARNSLVDNIDNLRLVIRKMLSERGYPTHLTDNILNKFSKELKNHSSLINYCEQKACMEFIDRISAIEEELDEIRYIAEEASYG